MARARKKLPSKIFKVLVDGKPVEVKGWESTPALAIAPDGPKFTSVMLLNGGILERGFPSLDAAHSFNIVVSLDKKLHPGTPNLLEFYEKGGGLGAVKVKLAEIRKKTETVS